MGILVSGGLFLAGFLQIIFNILSAIRTKGLVDFLVYRQAVGAFLKGSDIYHQLFSLPLDRIPFNYPPSALIFLSLLKIFPLKTTEIGLTIISLISLWLTIWLVFKLLSFKTSLSLFLFVAALLTQTFPVKFTLILGQINLIVLVFIFLSLYFLLVDKRTSVAKTVLSIGFLSSASLIKIFPLVLLIPLFIGGYRFYSLTIVVIFLAVNFFFFPHLSGLYFFKVLPQITINVQKPVFYDQSLKAMFLRFGLPADQASMLVLIIISLFFIAITLIFYRNLKMAETVRDKNKSIVETISFLIALVVIGNAPAWQHHLVFSYPLILVFLAREWGQVKKRRVWLVGTGLLIWLIMVLHFKNGNNPLLLNPLIASYQTILIILLLSFSLYRHFFYQALSRQNRGFLK